MEMAYHARRPWSLDGTTFDQLDQTIVIDGVVCTSLGEHMLYGDYLYRRQRYQSLCDLARLLDTADAVQKYKRHTLIFFHAICHELAHVDMT